MDGSSVLIGAGAISIMSAGAGAYHFLRAAGRRIDPTLPLVERGVVALECQARAAEKSADITKVLNDLHNQQNDTSQGLRVVSRQIEEIKEFLFNGQREN